MRIKYYFLFAAFSVVLASCSHVFSPALFQQDIAYQPKPTSFDTSKSATYISGGLNIYPSENLNAELSSGQINISRGHVFQNFNIAYGAFGVFGDYNNSSSNNADKTKPDYFNDKFFGAYGGRASANLFVTTGRTEIRYIGFEAVYSHEFGSYADFRQNLNRLGGYYVDPRTDLFTVALTTEVIFHNVDNVDIQHGIRGLIGTTFGHNPLNDTYYQNDTRSERFFRSIFPKASYFIRFKNYFGTFEVGQSIFFARFGYRF